METFFVSSVILGRLSVLIAVIVLRLEILSAKLLNYGTPEQESRRAGEQHES
jgi:hypothetical protein